jgi:hypothetical protein
VTGTWVRVGCDILCPVQTFFIGSYFKFQGFEHLRVGILKSGLKDIQIGFLSFLKSDVSLLSASLFSTNNNVLASSSILRWVITVFLKEWL